MQLPWTHARAGGGLARHAVRRRDVRIRAVVHVEERRLRAFEEDRAALADERVHLRRDVRDHRLDARGERERVVERLLEIDRRRLEVMAQHEVVVVEHLAQLRGEALARVQVLHADRAPRDLVLVRGPDAAPRGAELRLALRALARLVDGDVVRQDQRAGFRDAQPAHDVDAGLLELGDLVDQRLRRDDDAVADEAGDVAVEDSRRDQSQHGLASVEG